ncbi:two-component SAPR family response regulator [Krasilnikovia cinnamomea]|uniref:Two-component SAPR family response regulator n=1 Tax=Krasilnikovia cinnamomea TaxID=349313 RepID=A0A4Q7ZTD9_9ACTN|nr:BTAD domain-containing putative transcriptional regulator [Krasilnikovia cinnamomea]RZU53795.1 two-component SAPR family response regulator [Krasilnikovia cinnamomea]
MHPTENRRHASAAPGVTCRVVAAAAGYGKTTAMRDWYSAARASWHRGLPPGPDEPVDALAGVVVDEVQAGAGQIVFDDLPRLPDGTPRSLARALEGLAGAAGPVDVILASRWPPGTAAPALARVDVGPAELSLPVEQIADLLTGYDLTGVAAGSDAHAQELPERIHQATAGWPALVHLAAETLRTSGVPHGPLLPVIAAPGGLIASYLDEEVLPALPDAAVRLLAHVGDLAPVGAELCRALGHPQADEIVRLLAASGLLSAASSPRPLPGGPAPCQRVVPVLAEVVRSSRRTGSRPATGVSGPARQAPGCGRAAEVAAGFFDEHGPPVAAALAYHRAGRSADTARVLDRHGEAMLGGGHAETVVELLTALPVALCTPRLWLLLGDAQRATGALEAAARSHAAAAPGLPAGSAALAWRTGRIHYQRGDARAALAAFAEAGPGPHPPADAALLAAWTANAHLLAGRPEAALRHARDAVAAAAPADDDELTAALATAHVSVALCLGALGDDTASEEHYRLALPVAERIGDVVLLTRIYTNRTYRLLCAARYDEALAAARTCARYAAAARQPSLRAIATCNEADALAMLGHFDEAIRRYECAISAYRVIGSRRVAGAQLGLGEVYRRRGWREQARAAYDAAIRVAGEAGNAHVLVPAQAGLALALLADDLDGAAGHAAAAARTAAAATAVPALLAQGWVALCRGDAQRAGELADRACAAARAQGDRAGLADALELRGAARTGGADADPGRARAALRECHAIWTDAGASVEAARVMVTISRLPGAGPDDRIRGLLAAERLNAAGAVVTGLPPVTGRPGEAVAATEPMAPAAPVAIQALGRFEVRVDGEPVPPSRWQSRKARDLLRILVARRGRPMPRDELCELLWPDDDPAKTGHRLSVLLSILRAVLDPSRAYASDHYLVADQASIALDVTRARVDVEDFLAFVAQARRQLDAGHVAETRELLVTVEKHHGGDAFEDEPYAPWSGPLREQTRAAYLSMLRMLVQVSAAGVDAAVGYLLRLLERDPYDEAAHRHLVRRLVGAGRHGEARRAFDRYGEAMRAIGVRPPERSLLAPRAVPVSPATGGTPRAVDGTSRPVGVTVNGRSR